MFKLCPSLFAENEKARYQILAQLLMLYKAISQMNKSILLLIHHDPQSSGPPMF